MKSIFKKQNRRSIRLKRYDYSQAGAYFVTICAQKKECLFGRVIDGGMELNDAGKTIGHAWSDLPSRYASAELDEVVIMPNHIHGIIVINNSDVGAGLALPIKGAASGAPTLGDIVRTFKSISTRNVNRIRRYIADNHLQWQFDRENPAVKNSDGEEEKPWRASA